MIRHFTATGFVVHGNSTLLHWHEKVQEWLPPGGHVEPNEDLVQTTLREIKEETGFDAEITPTQSLLDISNLEQVYAPYTVMIEDVVDARYGEHQHIDHIFFTRLVGGLADTHDGAEKRPDAPNGWRWVTLEELQAAAAFSTPDGKDKPPPEDVLKLGAAAIQHVSGHRPAL
jgi:8-oxo-dGTP pyrophosphatase MutT (NUDIX family)